jgi:uncharacterized protein with beta-barrel porin domain
MVRLDNPRNKTMNISIQSFRMKKLTLLFTLAALLPAGAQTYETYNYTLLQENGSTLSWTQNQRNLDTALVPLIALQNQGNPQGLALLSNNAVSPSIAAGAWYNVAATEVIGLINQATAAYQTFLNQLSPGLYTALPTVLFNSANVQNTQLQQRLWAMRSGTADVAEAPSADSGKNALGEGKKVVVPTAEPDQKWTTFVDGNGMWSQGQSVNNLPGYNTYAGGVQAGANYELLKGLNVGPYVGYQGTRMNFTGANSGGSSAVVNSVRFGLFGEYSRGGWYTDGILGGAYNSVNVNHGISVPGYTGTPYSSMANGNVSGGEFDSLLGTGYDFRVGKLSIGPMTSLQYTYLHLGGAQESGAGILNQNIGSQDTSSLLYTLGGQAHYDLNLTQSVRLQPYISLAWQHEFLQNGYNLTSSILGQSYNYGTTSPGRDQYIAGIGGNLVLTRELSAYLVSNLINGDNKVFSQAISGGINLKF